MNPAGSGKLILRKILQLPFPGREELLAQVDLAHVVGEWGCGGLSIDMEVPGEAPPADLPDGVAPVCGDVHDEKGEYAGEFLLWVKDGRISALEYAWIGGSAPRSLPAAEAITPAPR